GGVLVEALNREAVAHGLRRAREVITDALPPARRARGDVERPGVFVPVEPVDDAGLTVRRDREFFEVRAEAMLRRRRSNSWQLGFHAAKVGLFRRREQLIE